MDAALRVLEAQGPDLPMDAVAAEAGVTKPVLYRYFSDKAALVEALAERGSEILLDRLLPAIKAGCPALASVRDGVGAYFAVIDEYPNLYWLLARRHVTIEDGRRPDSVQRNKESSPARSPRCSATTCGPTAWTPAGPSRGPTA